MAALNNVLGGGMSSRLFQEVREKRGLAYAVYSYHQGYSDAGAIKTYVGSTTGNVEEAVRVITEQLRRVQEELVSTRSSTAPSSSSRARHCWRSEHSRQDEPHRTERHNGHGAAVPRGDRRAHRGGQRGGHKTSRKSTFEPG